jgi:hypothetical protein
MFARPEPVSMAAKQHRGDFIKAFGADNFCAEQ